MPDPDPIPDEMKWKIAAKLVSALPVMYDITFRDAVGEDYDRLEMEIWMHMAGEAGAVARSFQLPASDAEEIMHTLRVIQTVFFGPEIRTEPGLSNPDRAVIMIRRCPFLYREKEMRETGGQLLTRCLAFSIATVEVLNPAYTLRFVRSMCAGDRNCELKIIRKTDAEKEGK
jgi:hypothetical protein